jgi:hypothetical protein
MSKHNDDIYDLARKSSKVIQAAHRYLDACKIGGTGEEKLLDRIVLLNGKLNDTITALREDNEVLRQALREIVDADKAPVGRRIEYMTELAQAALNIVDGEPDADELKSMCPICDEPMTYTLRENEYWCSVCNGTWRFDPGFLPGIGGMEGE